MAGELRFGAYRGTVPAIVDRETWERAQRVSVTRGRKRKSDRLLARLGVLRCATCGARMVVGSANHRAYALYRCPPTGDCPARVTVSAEKVEALVVAEVKRLLAGIEGTASRADGVRAAAAAHDAAQEALDAAIRAFTGLEGEKAAQERLSELREARDATRDRYEELAAYQDAMAVAVNVGDWDDLTLDERRGLIRAVIQRVTVAPGRGDDRIRIETAVEP